MHACDLKDDDGKYLVCHGFQKNVFKTVFYYLLCLCSGGFLFLIAYWRPDWALRLKCSACSLHNASYILIKTSYGRWFVEKIKTKSLDYTRDQDIYGEHEGAEATDNEMDQLLAESASISGSQKITIDVDMGCSTLTEIRVFMHRHLTYIWREDCGKFELLRALDECTTPSTFYRMTNGLKPEEVYNRRKLFGPNTIDVKVKSYGRLFFEQAANPFYVFQLFSIILWSTDEYYYYASAIFILSFGSILITIYQTRKHLVNLRNMVGTCETVTVIRDNGVQQPISSEDIVPGDVLVIRSSGMMMPCDAALISGNCIVNESILTGESVPVTKIPLPRESGKDGVASEEKERYYKPEAHKKHTLFNGTRIIQTRYIGEAQVLAVVVRTGYSTTKGSLIRSILCPKPVAFTFLRDSQFFLGFMVVVAMSGFIYSIYFFHQLEWSAGEIALMALDLITIAVPPALPVAMAVGTVYALHRLKNHAIYCIDPSRINICGNLDLICFDKTGTLTEDGLDILGVVAAENSSFKDIVPDGKCLPYGSLLTAMATCHSLTVIDGQLSGDPLDLKMFEATDWILEEPGRDSEKFESLAPTIVKPNGGKDLAVELEPEVQTPFEVGIVRQFPFSSDMQRMSVITRKLGAPNMEAYVKGAPETVVNLCDVNTVPSNFQEVLHEHTRHGYRVLAFAFRPLESKLSWHNAQRIHRDEVESNLTFLGLLVLQNALKIETTPVICILQEGAIRTIMVTGDNMLTAISVARECEMVKPCEKVILASTKEGKEESDETRLSWSIVGEVNKAHEIITEDNIPESVDTEPYRLAIQGEEFSLIRNTMPNLLEMVLARGTIFARMSPVQKTHLIEDLQKSGYYVGMCGDGANDCGALKAAHTGISLSEAEASVASPFTSKDPTIQCVPKVIREGRAALVTSFGMFKFMALYSIVQFVSVLILYSFSSSLGDLQFLYIDLVLIGCLAVVMGRTEAYPTLVKQSPIRSLKSPVILFSLLSQISIQIGFQLAGMYYLRKQTWYIPVNESAVVDDAQIVCHDNAVLFSLTSFQYILLGLVFSQGPPYRLPAYHNRYLLGVLVILMGFTIVLTVYPGEGLAEVLELAPIPEINFRLKLLGIAACNLVISCAMEHYVAHSKWLKHLMDKIFSRSPRRPFKATQLQSEVDFTSVSSQY